MKEVTLVYAYYENPQMLSMQLLEWMAYLPMFQERVRYIIVDDGSQINPARDVCLRYGGRRLDLSLFRVLKDVPWGQDGARNIGMHHLETEWALMTDMDHIMTRAEIGSLLQCEPDRKHYYMPLRLSEGVLKRPHPNSYLMHKHDFWRMGGYDEDFVGFYGSDGNFRKCAKGAGLREIQMDDVSLLEIKPDQVLDCNTRNYSRKEGEYYAAANPVLEAKRRGPAYRAKNPLRLPYERVL